MTFKMVCVLSVTSGFFAITLANVTSTSHVLGSDFHKSDYGQLYLAFNSSLPSWISVGFLTCETPACTVLRQ